MGGGAGMPSFGDINCRDARARRAGRRGARPDPGRRHGRVGRRAIVGIYDKGKGALAVHGDRVEVQGHAASPRSTTRFAAFIRGEGGFGESRGRRAAGPPKMPGHDSPTTRSRTRHASRPGAALPPVRRPQPAALRPGVRQARRLPEADPPRPVHLRLHRPRVAARVVRLRRRPSSRAWTRASRSP